MPYSGPFESRFQKVIDLMAQVQKLAEDHHDIASLEAIKILKRFLQEQATYNEEEKRFVVKEKREVKSDFIQSAYDPEATFRDKAGKKHSGYSLNLTETCSEENSGEVCPNVS